MSDTDNLTRECNPMGIYISGDPLVPAPLLRVALVHCYSIIVFGSLGKRLASRLNEATIDSALYLNAIKLKDRKQVIAIGLC